MISGWLDKYTKRKYLTDFIDTMTFCETQHFYGKSTVKFFSHFWDRPVPIFSDVRFSYLALKKSCAFYRQMHAVQFMSTAGKHSMECKQKQLGV